MSLTKQDLHAIKSIVDTSIDDAITNRIEPMMDRKIEELRTQTANGFAGSDDRMERIEADVRHMRSKIDKVEDGKSAPA